MIKKILVPRNCFDYGEKTDSGYYTIDPLKLRGTDTKVKVFCDFERGGMLLLYVNHYHSIQISIVHLW